MKKIFYFIASAIVALGAVACQNEVDENITPGTQNDVVSFTVSFDDNTRIALGGVENGEASFVFEGNETLYLDYNMNIFEFTNTPENPYTFTGEGEGLSEIVNNYSVTITNKTGDDLQVASWRYDTFGEAAYFKFQNKIDGDVTLSLSNYVIHCTTGADAVTLYCDYYDGGDDIAPESLVLPANGEYWINLENAYASEINVSYKINDETVKEATLDAKVNGNWGFKIFNLGALVPAVAEVNGVKYTDLSKALTAAGTTEVVTLLADATNVATACVINANGHALTTGDGFLALKNYNNANGYYDVVAVTNDVQWHVVGNHLNDNKQWDVVNRNTPMYKITGTNLVVAGNVDLKANNELKFVDGTTWQSTSVGAPSTSNIDATTWFHAGGDNIKVAADGTYNLYYDTENKVVIIADINTKLPDLTFKTYYLNTGGSSLWNQADAWFAGHFWTGTAARDYKMVASGEDNIFEIEVPIGFTDVIFIRMGNEATDFSNMWTSGNNGYWNKTNNLTISGSKNCYTITAWGQGTDVCSGAWSTK